MKRCAIVAAITTLALLSADASGALSAALRRADAAAAPSAEAVTRSKTLNAPHQGRTSDCVRLRDPAAPIPLRFPDGTSTGFFVSGQYPASALQKNERDQKALDRAGCTAGTVEIDAREVVDSPAGKMLFHPGGPNYPYPGGQEKWGRYGHILLSDLVPPLPKAPDPYDGTPVGNGVTCPMPKPGDATDGVYLINPMPVPNDMYYKPAQGHSASKYNNYGDKGHGEMYMVWNWVQNGSPSAVPDDNHVPGGGYVRAVLQRRTRFERGDVAPLRTVSYGPNDKQNGWVTAVYGRVYTGREYLWGWVIASYERWSPGPDGRTLTRKVDVLWPASRGPLPDKLPATKAASVDSGAYRSLKAPSGRPAASALRAIG